MTVKNTSPLSKQKPLAFSFQNPAVSVPQFHISRLPQLGGDREEPLIQDTTHPLDLSSALAKHSHLISIVKQGCVCAGSLCGLEKTAPFLQEEVACTSASLAGTLSRACLHSGTW